MYEAVQLVRPYAGVQCNPHCAECALCSVFAESLASCSNALHDHMCIQAIHTTNWDLAVNCGTQLHMFVAETMLA